MLTDKIVEYIFIGMLKKIVSNFESPIGHLRLKGCE